MNLYKEMQGRKTGIEQGAVFHETSKVGENVYVGAFTCVSEKVKIGDESQIYPHVYIGKNVKIGKNCIIGAGAIIPEGKIIHDNSLVIGVGKIVRTVDEEDLARVRAGTQTYINRSDDYRQHLKRID